MISMVLFGVNIVKNFKDVGICVTSNIGGKMSSEQKVLKECDVCESEDKLKKFEGLDCCQNCIDKIKKLRPLAKKFNKLKTLNAQLDFW
jgi:hypothetical protein